MLSNADQPILRVEGLVKSFRGPRGSKSRAIRAVDGVSFELAQGETIGIVGESGCGKSTLARCVARLLRVDGGAIEFQGQDITHLSPRQMRPVRRDLAMVFQDPTGSLNPRARVGSIIAEPLDVHLSLDPVERRARVFWLLQRVGLEAEHATRFPHEFSGGQRQRIGIARALALDPKLVICDEPVSALDVSVQAQILNLLADLQAELGLTYVFIAHDLEVVRHLCRRVVVMYLGQIVEQGATENVYAHTRHPYTSALISAVPMADPVGARLRSRTVLKGDVPSPFDPPSGCRFHPRCPRARPMCAIEAPALEGSIEHAYACHFPIEREG